MGKKDNKEKKNKVNKEEEKNEQVKGKGAAEEKADDKENDITDELIKLSQGLKAAEEKIEKLEEENKELNDKLLRRAAEFENYKRRTENDQFNLVKYSGENVITKLLPVYDDMERSLDHLKEDDSANGEGVKKGLQMVFDKFTKTLKEQGVEKIKAKGEPFDFNYHEALMQKEAEDVPAHTVLEEIEPGYMYKDKVLRHAKVIVSQEAADRDKEIESE